VLTIRPLSRAEVRGIDARAAQELGMPTVILMENAGRGAASWLLECGMPMPMPGSGTDTARPRVLILCGPGNNGGDGGVVARHLDLWGYPVRIVWFARADSLRGDAAIQFQILARSGVDQTCWDDPPGAEVTPERLDGLLAEADWLVDALLGTGLTRPVEGLLRTVIAAINRSGKPVLALDLPSGLDADTGQPLGAAVVARATATFVAPKLGFAVPGAAAYTGTIKVLDIGVPRAILEPYRIGSDGADS
jgi:NAD(P)H-hydrate epimerase